MIASRQKLLPERRHFARLATIERCGSLVILGALVNYGVKRVHFPRHWSSRWRSPRSARAPFSTRVAARFPGRL